MTTKRSFNSNSPPAIAAKKLIGDLQSLSLEGLDNDSNVPEYAKVIIRHMHTLLTTASTLLGEQFSAQDAIEDQERRRSLVIAGIEEPSDNFTKRDQYKKDRESIQEIFDVLDIATDPVCSYRLGKPDKNKRRLMKVILPSSFFQTQALRSAKQLKGHAKFNGIFLRPSLTKEERDAEYQMRKQVRELNASGMTKYRISKGKIINAGSGN